ncbi:MAG: hypothetical protein AABW56_01800 [Nanoarchaeota archaeon]
MTHNIVRSKDLELMKLNENLSLDCLIEESHDAVKSKLCVSTESNSLRSILFKVGSVEKLRNGQLVAIYHNDIDVLAVSKPLIEKFLKNLENYDRRNLPLTESQENLLYFLYLITEDRRFIPYMQSVVNGGYGK